MNPDYSHPKLKKLFWTCVFLAIPMLIFGSLVIYNPVDPASGLNCHYAAYKMESDQAIFELQKAFYDHGPKKYLLDQIAEISQKKVQSFTDLIISANIPLLPPEVNAHFLVICTPGITGYYVQKDQEIIQSINSLISDKHYVEMVSNIIAEMVQNGEEITPESLRYKINSHLQPSAL